MTTKTAKLSSKTSTPSSPPVKLFLPAAVILMLIGWSGFALVFFFAEPSGGTRWALFFTGIIAVIGTALPVTAYMNRRFPSTPPPSPGVIVRQAIWAGLYVGILAWLQFGRALFPLLSILLAGGIILVEAMLRIWERSQWNPRQPRRPEQKS